MRRFERPLRLDDVLFALAIAITPAFAVDRFLEQEHEKTAIARAQELRKSALARAADTCPPIDSPAIQSDVHARCLPPNARGR